MKNNKNPLRLRTIAEAVKIAEAINESNANETFEFELASEYMESDVTKEEFLKLKEIKPKYKTLLAAIKKYNLQHTLGDTHIAEQSELFAEDDEESWRMAVDVKLTGTAQNLVEFIKSKEFATIVDEPVENNWRNWPDEIERLSAFIKT